MRIVYCGKTAYWAAYAMAAIHIGIYKEERLPCFDYILKQWELCCLYGEQRGNLVYMGIDQEYREIFIIGAGHHGSMIEKAYKGINTMYRIAEDNYFVHEDRWDGIISSLSNRLYKYTPLKVIGAKIFIYWFKKSYDKWVEKVKDSKKEMEG